MSSEIAPSVRPGPEPRRACAPAPASSGRSISAEAAGGADGRRERERREARQGDGAPRDSAASTANPTAMPAARARPRLCSSGAASPRLALRPRAALRAAFAGQREAAGERREHHRRDGLVDPALALHEIADRRAERRQRRDGETWRKGLVRRPSAPPSRRSARSTSAPDEASSVVRLSRNGT